MCHHRSYVVREDGKVFNHPTKDHHTDIRKEHRIHDGFHEGELRHASIECRPKHNLFDLKGWEFIVDEKVRPDWWSKDLQSAAIKKLEREFIRFAAMDSTYIFPGDLDLNHLDYIPENCTIIALGALLIDSINVIPPSCTLIAKQGRISLMSCREVYSGSVIVTPELHGWPELRRAHIRHDRQGVDRIDRIDRYSYAIQQLRINKGIQLI